MEFSGKAIWVITFLCGCFFFYYSIFSLVIGLFILALSSWVSFISLYFSRNFSISSKLLPFWCIVHCCYICVFYFCKVGITVPFLNVILVIRVFCLFIFVKLDFFAFLHKMIHVLFALDAESLVSPRSFGSLNREESGI